MSSSFAYACLAALISVWIVVWWRAEQLSWLETVFVTLLFFQLSWISSLIWLLMLPYQPVVAECTGHLGTWKHQMVGTRTERLLVKIHFRVAVPCEQSAWQQRQCLVFPLPCPQYETNPKPGLLFSPCFCCHCLGAKTVGEGWERCWTPYSGTYLCGGSTGHVALLLLFLFVLALTCYLCSAETNRQLLPKCAKYDQKTWRQMGRSMQRLAAPVKPVLCPGGDRTAASTVSGKDKEWVKSLTFSRVKCFRFRPVACDRLSE